MNALCIDDEALALDQTMYICEQTGYFTNIVGFTKETEGLAAFDSVTYDVAFLDIDMPEIKGIDLATKIKEKSPSTKIIFITGYSHFALDAFKIHADGYLCKPINVEDLKRELDYWYNNKTDDSIYDVSSGVYIQTFGNFEVFIDGEVIAFERKKSKEILAYLVSKQGTGVTRAELAAIIWENDVYDHSKQKQLDVFIRCLFKTLKSYDIENIINMNNATLRVVPSEFKCDFYDLLNGSSSAKNRFSGTYMSSYSWAEYITAYLDSRHS